MSNHPQRFNDPQYTELFQLLAIMSEQSLTADELARLETLTANDDEARRIYRQSMYVLAQLELHGITSEKEGAEASRHKGTECERKDEEVVVQLSEAPSSSLTSQPYVVRPKSRLERILKHEFGVGISVAILAMATVLIVAGHTYISPRLAKHEEQKQQKEEKKQESNIYDNFVARLDRQHNVTWLKDSEPPPHQPKLVPGRRLVIASGLLKIDYLTGATLIIEGPADFYVGTKAQGTKAKGKDQEKIARSSIPNPSSLAPHPSSNSGYLASGKLVARCDTPKSKGFTIKNTFVSSGGFWHRVYC